MSTDLSRTAAGIDASRRVGWAKAYEAEELAMLVTGYMLAMTRLLKDGEHAEARAALLRCLAKLQSTPAGRQLLDKVLELNGYLADWLAEGMEP